MWKAKKKRSIATQVCQSMYQWGSLRSPSLKHRAQWQGVSHLFKPIGSQSI